MFPNWKSDRVRLIKRWFKYFWQRRTRGWDDSETWSLDYSLAKIIAPRLKRFKEVKCCHPMELTQEEWDTILDKMIFAFEKLGEDDYQWPYEEIPDEVGKAVEEGRELFHKYYHDLWW